MKNKNFESDSIYKGLKFNCELGLSKINPPKKRMNKEYNDILTIFHDKQKFENFESCYNLRKNSKINKEKISSVKEKNSAIQIILTNEETNENEDRLFMTNSNFYKTKNNSTKRFSVNNLKFENSNFKELIKKISITKRKIENESKDIQNMLLFTKNVKANYENLVKNNQISNGYNSSNISLPKIYNKKQI